MPVEVIPQWTQRSRFGGIVGKVLQVNTLSATEEDISTTIGNPQLAKALVKSGPVMRAQIDLELDPASRDGFRWTHSRGSDVFPVREGRTGHRPPASGATQQDGRGVFILEQSHFGGLQVAAGAGPWIAIAPSRDSTTGWRAGPAVGPDLQPISRRLQQGRLDLDQMGQRAMAPWQRRQAHRVR
jgi:hypothetical protein